MNEEIVLYGNPFPVFIYKRQFKFSGVSGFIPLNLAKQRDKYLLIIKTCCYVYTSDSAKRG